MAEPEDFDPTQRVPATPAAADGGPAPADGGDGGGTADGGAGDGGDSGANGTNGTPWWKGRRGWLVGVGAGVAVLLIAVIAAVALNSGGGSSDDSTTDTTASDAKRSSTTSTTRDGDSSSTTSTPGGTTTPGGGTGTTVPGGGGPGTTAPPATVAEEDLPTEEEMNATYNAAFEAECRSIWSHAGGDGLLWDPDDLDSGGYTVDACLEQMDPEMGWFYADLEDAHQGGIDDADAAAYFLTIYGQLQPTGGPPFDLP